MLPRDREIALARSAAPADVSRDATVMVLTERGFEVAERGSNGVTCVVNRSQPRSLEPHCFDAEGSATVLPIELRRTELLRVGRSAEEIEREIGQASGPAGAPSGASSWQARSCARRRTSWSGPMGRSRRSRRTPAAPGSSASSSSARPTARALEIARSCPHVRYGGSIVIREIEPTS